MEQSTVITGFLNEEHIVQKSTPLVLMRNIPFDLGELKVFNVYLSRINSHDYEKRSVKFTKRELESLLGFEEMRVDKLFRYTRTFLGKIAEIPLSPNEYIQLNLFSSFKFYKNEFGEWEILMTCTEEAKEYIFDIDNIGYIRYMLKNVIVLTSTYSYFLYTYIILNRFRGTWTESVERLRKEVFQCNEIETYKEYKYFKRDVLDRAMNEVNEKTDVNISYNVVKRGRHVTDIHFIYDSESHIDHNQLTFLSEPALAVPDAADAEVIADLDPAEKFVNDEIEFLSEAVPYDFSKLEMRILIDLVNKIIPFQSDRNEYQRAKYNYLNHKKLIFERQYFKKSANGKGISHPFDYFKKMIEQDIKE
jgi:hypothetical protein